MIAQIDNKGIFKNAFEKIVLLSRIYFIPIMILLAGFGIYYAIFEVSYSLKNQYFVSQNITQETLQHHQEALKIQSAPTEPEIIHEEITTETTQEAQTQASSEEQTQPQNNIQHQQPAYPLYKVNVRSLNVRKEPKQSAPVVGSVVHGQEITALEIQGEWVRIHNGWVVKRLLIALDNNKQEGIPYEVLSVSLNVRQQPSLQSPIVAKKTKGQEVFVQEERDGWLKIAEGWVSQAFLKQKGEN